MTQKQIKIVRIILNDHLNDLDDTIKEYEDGDPETLKGLKEEQEACEEALKVICKGSE